MNPINRKPVDARLGVSWRAILGVETDPPSQNPRNPQKKPSPDSSEYCADSEKGVPPAKQPPRAAVELDAAELRRRYAEHVAALAGWSDVPAAEVELRAWTETALDYIEADPARDALPNREARTVAARALAAAGIPDPAASPLRIERGGPRRG